MPRHSQRQQFTENLVNDYQFVTGFGGPPTPVVIDEQLAREGVTQDLAAGPLNYTTAIASDFMVCQVAFAATVPILETFTITLDNGMGAAFDTVIAQWTLLGQRYVFFTPNLILMLTDQINMQCTNAGLTGSVSVSLLYGIR